MPMVEKQFTLYVENKPGAIARITRMLASAKINIEGISVSETTDVALIQIVTSNARATRRVLVDSGVPFTTQDVVMLKLKNEPGALSNVVSRLAQADINVNYVYATGCACSSGCECFVIISAPDLGAVEKVVRGRKGRVKSK
jgi:hypothetical protein